MHALNPYLSPAEREDRLRVLGARLSGQLIEIGFSVQGLPIHAIRIPGPGPSAPRVLCTANIHGQEFIGAMVALGLVQRLAEPDPPAQCLLEKAEVWVIPCLNPDAYQQTWESGGHGRLSSLRTNANGVDLNRNFPLPMGARPSRLPGAGSRKPGAITYRGARPLSEPESAALERLLAEQAFSASVNLHSFMGTLIPARVIDSAEYRAYRQLCGAFRKEQTRWRYRRLASRWLDVFTGELEDHQHHAHGCWAVCVEHMTIAHSIRQHLRAPNPFWRFNPRDPGAWLENDIPAIIQYLLAAIQMPRQGSGCQ